MRLILILVLLVLASGCSRRISDSASRTHKDSVFIKEREFFRDTIIIIKGDTAHITIPTKAAQGRAITSSKGKATVSVMMKHDTIYANAICDETQLQLHLKEKEVQLYKTVYDSLLQQQTFLKLKVPDSVKYLAIFGALCLLLMLIYIIYLLKK